MITVKHPMGTITYTEEELEQELSDLEFLRDAFLVILNPGVCEESDLPFGRDDMITFARQMYDRLNYSQEFINKCFKQYKNEI